MKNRHSMIRMIALAAAALPLSLSVTAQAQTETLEEVVITGIRGSLASALQEKRSSDNLVEIIQSEDIGKLPDQNLAEVLENITGVQITREAGVGTGVQIRGSGSNITLMNGVATVGSGNGRTGIDFEDVDASIIAAVEVTKAPEAKTIEGALGGVINLKTIRPLDLKETLGSISIKGETSSLSDEGASPRISGAFGDTWSTDAGDFGFVISGSTTKSDVSHFRPRTDRDNLTLCVDPSDSSFSAPSTCDNVPDGTTHFLGAQFFNQVLVNQEYETTNVATSFEFAPNDTTKFYLDLVFNDQERRGEGHRAQASNISRLQGNGNTSYDALGNPTPGDNANFWEFETYDLGTMPGSDGLQDLGSATMVTQGSFSPLQEAASREAGFGGDGRGAPFLRSSSDGDSRITDNTMFRLGGEFEISDSLRGSAEVSKVTSESVESNLQYTVNFINPNSYIAESGTLLDGVTPDYRDENGVPYIFDLDGNIAWDINYSDPYAPTPEELLDPSNYVNDSGEYRYRTRENQDTTFRTDFEYDLDWKSITSVDFGLRHNTRTSERVNTQAAWNNKSQLSRSLNASYISGLMIEMPDNFGDGTGTDLFVSGLLMLDPELAANSAETVAAINAARLAQNAVTAGVSTPIDPIGALIEREGEFFDIEETSTALYAQANFEAGIFRGNAGFRYVQTDLDSTAYVGGALETISNDYNFLLPRLNLVADVNEDVVVRASYSEDLRRPDFDSISASRTFPGRGGVNGNSVGGNPLLSPEEVKSFDLAVEYYFAPSSVVSLGYFNKKRQAIIDAAVEAPAEVGGLRDVIGSADALFTSCEGGGIWSAETESGIFGDGETGVCVGNQTEFNTSETTTQSGYELAVQYDLGQFEDTLGWASGFGILANFTKQEQDNNESFTEISGDRPQAFFEANGFTDGVVELPFQLLDLSETAYNVTVYYEDESLSARMRYTYRSEYYTDDLPGTGNVYTPLGGRGVVNARGQLNASAVYSVTDNFSLSLEGINLTEEDMDVSCLNEEAVLCYRGITDRRVTFGASYRF